MRLKFGPVDYTLVAVAMMILQGLYFPFHVCHHTSIDVILLLNLAFEAANHLLGLLDLAF